MKETKWVAGLVIAFAVVVIAAALLAALPRPKMRATRIQSVNQVHSVSVSASITNKASGGR